ncbi:3-dehydroquinate synthase [Microbulbifer thermotolerans]|uniref:3-dehydroquinate synthase n=1 Tax=Microbulbifer thermotolerans TaxID=252514 RepID=A0A143HIQ8_MICTH|nr:3-dehydroquinate synthase [Microbulbifer thermotolerans]AMX01360.1 3-dehydroquinate synthase [Microbulbifer thermotolerans]WKT60824.1 3-dehydroquinate synthase [Microbulbifer thermotolerans]SFC33985.1 3-dehydroquinate synthase [Microbulbifer thermotolerans]
MHSLNVELGDRSYPIVIGSQLLGDPQYLLPYIRGRQVCVVTNETVAPLYLERLLEGLSDFDKVDTIELPDGETFKTLDTLNRIFDLLLERRHNRTTTLIALGGGVIGDMTGFAAACYQRGVDFVQVPTTLLAQVDSSVGGKTGVNHPLGKNMIGAFYQPRMVLADMDTLSTLPKRELAAGIAEVIKYGLICDAPFFEWLEGNMPRLLACEPEALAYAVDRCCRDKAAVVAEDERESGRRAILNFGHTFGHAIEAVQGYGSWLHGEAVAAGMVMAAELSSLRGDIDAGLVGRIRALLAAAELPLAAPEGMAVQQFLDAMAVDKKVLDGRLRLVLLRALGTAQIVDDTPRELLVEALRNCGAV